MFLISRKKKTAVTQVARRSANGNAVQTPDRDGDIAWGRSSISGMRKNICREIDRTKEMPAFPRT